MMVVSTETRSHISPPNALSPSEHSNDGERNGQPSSLIGCMLEKKDFAPRPMSLKKFLEPFDHTNLTNIEAGEKYAAYKTSFVKQQLEEYFERFKSHAWFREKYHPDVRPDPSVKERLWKRRLDTFMELYNNGYLNNLALTSGNEASIAVFLDKVAIKLAGGSDDDVHFLTTYEQVKRGQMRSLKDTPVRALSKAEKLDTKLQSKPKSESVPPEDPTDKTEQKLNKPTVNEKDTDANRHHTSRIDSKRLREKKKKQTNVDRRRTGVANSSGSRSSSSSDNSSSTSSEDDGSSSSGSSSESDANESGSGSSSSGSDSSASSDSSGSNSSGQSSDEDNDDGSSSSRSTSSEPAKKMKRKKRTASRTVRESSSESVNHLDQHAKSKKKHKLRGQQQKSDVNLTQSKRQLRDSAVDDNENETEQSASHTNDNGLPTDLEQDLADDAVDETLPKLQQRPLHHTHVLFLPHIPFAVYQKDLNALFSTSPHFLRLCILDPFIVPSTDSKPGQAKEAFFVHESESSSPGIVLRRPGWATFVAQYKQGDVWVNVDLESLRTKFHQQATDAQAPTDLLDCLRWAQVVNEHVFMPCTDRVRFATSTLWNALMSTSPELICSKALIRRHLVLAARLADELDRARGLWMPVTSEDADVTANEVPQISVTKDDEHELNISLNREPMDTEPVSDDELLNGDKSMDSVEPANDTSKYSDEDALPQQDVQLEDKPNAVEDSSKNSLDPGDDLIKAATILEGLKSTNPLLSGLTDYLVDEGNAEEELLLSAVMKTSTSALSGVQFMQNDPNLSILFDDTELTRALDRLLLYLRVVHSVDFYAPAFYPQEDAMPHPCQLMHIRPGQTQLAKAKAEQKTSNNTSSRGHHTTFASQLNRLMRLIIPIGRVEGQRLGFRDEDEVVEAFVKANTRRKKRKTDVIWVCLLSDKKFRDPIYVKKHILNKHSEKVEMAKKDNAHFFNNYLLDPSRPQLPLEPHLPNHRKKRSSPEIRDKSLSRNNARLQPVSIKNDKHEISTSKPMATSDRYGGGSQWQFQPREQSNTYRSFSDRRHTHGHCPGAGFIHRPYGNRFPYYQQGPPFTHQRSLYHGPPFPRGGYSRGGYQRRPYVDLDAP